MRPKFSFGGACWPRIGVHSLARMPLSTSRALTHSNNAAAAVGAPRWPQASAWEARAPGARSARTPLAPRRLTHGAVYPPELRSPPLPSMNSIGFEDLFETDVVRHSEGARHSAGPDLNVINAVFGGGGPVRDRQAAILDRHQPSSPLISVVVPPSNAVHDQHPLSCDLLELPLATIPCR